MPFPLQPLVILIVITSADADEFTLLETEDELEVDAELEDEELEDEELEIDELVELDDEELEIDELLIIASDDELEYELDRDDEIDIDEEVTEDEISDELVTEEMAVDELLIDDEIATAELDELSVEETALLELDVPLPPPAPQATSVLPRTPMIIGLNRENIVKLSCVIVMVDYTIRSSGLYTSNRKELNRAK